MEEQEQKGQTGRDAQHLQRRNLGHGQFYCRGQSGPHQYRDQRHDSFSLQKITSRLLVVKAL